ncbi:MAG: hypothetical protein WD050_02480 [Actinomycetota bacterium]
MNGIPTIRARLLGAAAGAAVLMATLAGPAWAPPELNCFGLEPTITGTTSGETINGTSGDDVILALQGADTINAGGGNDQICADTRTGLNAHADTINGEGGNDHIYTDAGNDTISGGSGTDVICVCLEPNDIANIDLANTIHPIVTEDGFGYSDDPVTGIENLKSFSTYNDELAGDDDPNTITAQASGDSDVVRGKGGNDTLNTVDSSSGDTIFGGPGTDNCSKDPADTKTDCE